MIIMISGVGSEFEIERFKVEGGGGGLVLSEILTRKKIIAPHPVPTPMLNNGSSIIWHN